MSLFMKLSHTTIFLGFIGKEDQKLSPLSCCHLSLLSHLSYFSCHPFLLCRISRSRVQFLPPMILVIKVEFQHKVGRYACLLSKLQAQRFLVWEDVFRYILWKFIPAILLLSKFTSLIDMFPMSYCSQCFLLTVSHFTDFKFIL